MKDSQSKQRSEKAALDLLRDELQITGPSKREKKQQKRSRATVVSQTVEVDSQDSLGRTRLHRAVAAGHQDNVKFLLHKHQAEVRFSNSLERS
jgi:ankyrin repeat protein